MSRVDKKNSKIDCAARTVREAILHDVVTSAVSEVCAYDDSFFERYRKSLETALGANNEGVVRAIDEKLQEKQRAILKLSPEDKRYDKTAGEIYALQEEKQKALLSDADRAASLERVDAFICFARSQAGQIRKYDESLVRRFIEQITVHDNYFTVLFKSDMKVAVEG